MTAPSKWVSFDPQPLIDELSGNDVRFQIALMMCRSIRWNRAGTMGYFRDEHIDEGWVWDEALATAVQTSSAVFVIDFLMRGDEMRAYRIERAIELSLVVDDR